MESVRSQVCHGSEQQYLYSHTQEIRLDNAEEGDTHGWDTIILNAAGSLDSPGRLNVILAGDIPFVTQNLAEQLGVAAWEREMLAAGIFQAGVSIAQKNVLGMSP